jgi:hypothetical protein
MTFAEITELFISAAETDRRLPINVKPAHLKAMAIPYYHDWADMNGWGAERLQEERQAFWDSRSTRLKASDISDWERANELMLHVQNVDQRRCLWNWAIAKAGGKPFNQWCRGEGIIRETGRQRKDRALKAIVSAISVVQTVFNHDKEQLDALPNQPENSYESVIIEHVTAWISPGGRPAACDFDKSLGNFDWAENENAKRRARERKRRQAA